MQSLVKPKIYLFLPIGIPGMNIDKFNEVLTKNFQDKDFPYSYITKTEKAQDLNHNKENFASSQSLLEEILHPETKILNQKIEDLLRNISSDKDNNIRAALIEKCYFPNTIKSQLIKLSDFATIIDIKVIPVVPLITENKFSLLRKEKEAKFPFSLEYFLTCLHHIQQQGNYPKSPEDQVRCVSALIRSFNAFRNVDLAELLNSYGLSTVMHVPFHSSNLEYPPELKNLLVKILSDFHAEEKSGYSETTQEFTELIDNFLAINVNDQNIGDIDNSIKEFLADHIPEFAKQGKGEEFKSEDIRSLTSKKESFIKNALVFLKFNENDLNNTANYVKAGHKALADTYPGLFNRYLKTNFEKWIKHPKLRFNNLQNNAKVKNVTIEPVLLIIIPERLILCPCIIDERLPSETSKYSSLNLFQKNLLPEFLNRVWNRLFGPEGTYSEKYTPNAVKNLKPFVERC